MGRPGLNATSTKTTATATGTSSGSTDLTADSDAASDTDSASSSTDSGTDYSASASFDCQLTPDPDEGLIKKASSLVCQAKIISKDIELVCVQQ